MCQCSCRQVEVQTGEENAHNVDFVEELEEAAAEEVQAGDLHENAFRGPSDTQGVHTDSSRRIKV